MLATRLPLLSVFAGGCLSGAALIGFWNAGAAPTTEPSRSATAQARHEPALASELHAGERPASVAPSRRGVEDVQEESRTEPGSSVADVLLRLEAAYRQALTAVPNDHPSSASGAPAPTALSAPPPPAAAPAPAPTETNAVVVEAHAPSIRGTAVARDAMATDTDARAPDGDAEAVLAARDRAKPRDIHVGDVHQSVHVGNVQQGDVHQVQQIAVLQYLQLLTVSPHAPVAAPTPTARRVTRRRPPPFPTSLTNPDNPWGFDFPPTVLVK